MTRRTVSNAKRRARRGERRTQIQRRGRGQMHIPMLHDRPINVVLFAGLGGSSLGLEQAGIRIDVAVNHDPEAVAVHAHNHPHTKHLCESVFDTSPLAVSKGRRVGVLWASPDCTDHSNAKGDKPRSSGRRSLATVVTDWARETRPDFIFVENVRELADWGPLLEVHIDGCNGTDGHDCIDGCRFGRRDNSQKGVEYAKWVKSIVDCGYRFASREMRACDYGAPTTRPRLYIVFVHESLGVEPAFPEPTHGPGLLPYKTASDCIDFSIPCPSIFLTRDEVKQLGLKCKRPLADKTLRRVARGLWKYVVRSAKPFIVSYHSSTSANSDRVADLDRPLPTQDTSNRFGIVAPALSRYNGQPVGQRVDEPLGTIDTTDRYALMVPTLVQTGYGEREGQEPRSLDLQQPLGTVVSCGVKHAVATAWLIKNYGERHPNEVMGQSLDKPVGTVTVRDHHSLAVAHISKLYGTSTGSDMRDPMPTVTATGNHLAEVRALLAMYPDTSDQPTTDQLVWIDGVAYVIVEVGLRMLVARELARANGFPDDFAIDIDINGQRLTGEAQVRLIGNAVVPIMARRLAEANCGLLVERRAA